MQKSIQIIQNGHWFVGSFSDIPGCYVQGKTFEDAKSMLSDALTLMVDNYKLRNEPLPFETDAPQINRRIKYSKISSSRLAKLLKNFNYHVDLVTDKFILFRCTDFPFKRLIIPNTIEISHEIICKIFGRENVIRVSETKHAVNES